MSLGVEYQIWWMPWNQMADPKYGTDSRPVKWPPPKAVLGFWESGYTADGSYSTVVALVSADSEADAKRVISRAWTPGVGEWRFCRKYSEGGQPGDRFPPCEWSIERGTWPWEVP